MRYLARAVVVAVLVISLTPGARAADVNGDGLETILLPLAFTPVARVPGAMGTIWSGAVWIHNGNDEAVYPVCPGMFGCTGGVPAGSMEIMGRGLGFDPTHGFLLTTSVEESQRVTFSNRIFELTRHGQPRGVEIPVVREGSFLRGTAVLLGVPVGSDVRVALRVYDPWIEQRFSQRTTPPLERVEVEILDEAQSVIATGMLRPEVLIPHEPQTIPGLAAIYDLAMTAPQINSLEHIHIRLQSVPEDAEYYAMVSVTHQETQTVSIITAQ